jgi:uncharacterized protein YndB with AHSA1/START domain
MDAVVDDRTLRLVRLFDAPAERLFDAWTDQDQFAAWFGPPGVTTVYCELDVKVGGAWRLLGRNTERDFAVSGKYLEVIRPERLAFTFGWHDKGDHAQPRDPETVVSLDFKPVGGKTRMTMVQSRFPDQASTANHNRGWDGSFDKLDALLARKA